MKKIYLLTLGLVAFVGTAMAQMPCPTAPKAERWDFSSAPVPHCVVTIAFLNPEPSWYIKLKDASNNYIPVLNTGPGTGNPAIYYVAVPDNGNVEFYYDCTVGTPVLIEYVWLDPNSPPESCQITNIINRGALPVKLTSFTGRLQNDNEVTLDWASGMEFENSRYEVERSADGKYFEKVGTLTGAGSTSNTSRYTFKDRLPGSGAYFYRLKQIDYDGVFEYSKVVYVNSKKGAGVVTKVFPNPFKGAVQLIGATSSDLTPNNIQVYSIGGQRINYRITGANSILIDPAAPDGIYILKMIEQNQQFRLVKSKASGTSY
jgi:hypothetical protein